MPEMLQERARQPGTDATKAIYAEIANADRLMGFLWGMVAGVGWLSMFYQPSLLGAFVLVVATGSCWIWRQKLV